MFDTSDMKLLHDASRTPRLEFGYSVSVDDDTLVIGSPGHVNPNGFHTGAAFVYDRLSLDLDFGFRQVMSHRIPVLSFLTRIASSQTLQALYPSTSLDADRVGQAVAVQSNVIAVTARGNWSGIIDTLHPRFEVQQVAITASVGSVVGQTFRLGWQQRYVPAAKGLKQRGASGLGDRPAYVSTCPSC